MAAAPAEPVHHCIVACDIEGYGRLDRNDPVRGALRDRFYALLDGATAHAGISVADVVRTDIGDGALLLIRPHVSKRRVLERLLRRLAAELVAGNALVGEPERLRLRAVVHAGEVTRDDNGAYGEDLNHAFRLLDSSELRECLAGADVPLAVIVSRAIYDGIVKHGHGGIDPGAFAPVVVTVKETRAPAWIWIPDPDEAPPAPPPPRVAPAVSNLPAPDPRFTGREGALAEIGRLLGAQRCRPSAVALQGLPGVGKTQLALEFAHRNAAGYDVLWWVRADRRATLIADLAELAGRLGLPQRGHRAVVAGLTEVLARYRRRLLIFDGAERPKDLADCLPGGRDGDVLITTWSREFNVMATPCKVELFTPAEAEAFLCARAPSRDRAPAADLARALGHLPLALEQAAAYVNRAGLTLDHYLELYRVHGEQLLFMGLDDHDDHESIELRFRSAFERIERRAPEAAQLAMLLSFLGPVTIPDELIRSVPDLLPAPLADVVGHVPTYLRNARGALVLHSLAEPEPHGLHMHPLVQAVIRRRLSRPAQQVWAGCAVRMLLRAWPDDPQDPTQWPRCADLVHHAMAAADLAAQLDAEPTDTASLLRAVGIYHLEQAGPVAAGTELALARGRLERALAILEATCRPDDPGIAVTLMHLGRALRRLDQLAEAKAVLERAVRVHEAADQPGPGLPAVLTHLASTLRHLGDHTSAQATLERALARYGDGPADRGGVAWTLTHLGRVLRRLGDHAGARDTLERALRLVDGAGHRCDHHVAAVLIQLGRVLRRLGDYDAASAALERALHANERVFGAAHHRTAEVLIHIGALLRDKGHLDDAQVQLERALAINVAAYGAEHSSTARTRTHLGRVLRRMERLPEAGATLERALADTERARGHDHPQVAWTLVHLSTVLQAQGHRDRAMALLERALAITERTYAPDHPDVAWILAHLSAVTILRDPRRQVAAGVALERALSITRSAYGKDHLDVAWVLTHVGTAFQHVGQLYEARRLLERALAIITRAAGADGQPHRQIVPTLIALGLTLRSLGEQAEAEARLHDAYLIASERLGPHHPETRAAWRALYGDVDVDVDDP